MNTEIIEEIRDHLSKVTELIMRLNITVSDSDEMLTMIEFIKSEIEGLSD